MNKVTIKNYTLGYDGQEATKQLLFLFRAI
jgi:hypothetical protein